MAWGHDTTVKDTESLLPKWWEQSLNTRDDEAGLPEQDITPYIDPKTFDLNIAKNAEIAQNNSIVIGNEHYDVVKDKTPHGFYATNFYVQTARDVIARTDPNARRKDFDYERGKFAEKLLGPMPMYDLDKPFPGKGKFDKRRGVNPRGSALTNYDAQRNITTAGHRPLTAEGMVKQVIFDELGLNREYQDYDAGLPAENITGRTPPKTPKEKVVDSDLGTKRDILDRGGDAYDDISAIDDVLQEMSYGNTEKELDAMKAAGLTIGDDINWSRWRHASPSMSRADYSGGLIKADRQARMDAWLTDLDSPSLVDEAGMPGGIADIDSPHWGTGMTKRKLTVDDLERLQEVYRKGQSVANTRGVDVEEKDVVEQVTDQRPALTAEEIAEERNKYIEKIRDTVRADIHRANISQEAKSILRNWNDGHQNEWEKIMQMYLDMGITTYSGIKKIASTVSKQGFLAGAVNFQIKFLSPELQVRDKMGKPLPETIGLLEAINFILAHPDL